MGLSGTKHELLTLRRLTTNLLAAAFCCLPLVSLLRDFHATVG